ncbi:MAG: spermidine synthase [Gammaproteobacteria bacterium]|jgi:spermidine synthase
MACLDTTTTDAVMKITTKLATSKTPDGETLVLLEHDGEYVLKVHGVPLMSTKDSASEQKMAELACRGLPDKPRVLIGGLGFGFTLRRVLALCPPDATVDVAELLPVIVDWNREFLSSVNGLLVDDPRVTIHIRDVAKLLNQSGNERYHAILLDVDNSPDPLVQKGNSGLYNTGGIARAKAALYPGGRVVYWSANEDKNFARALRKAFKNVECIPAKAYPQAKKFTHTLFVAQRD